MRLLMLLWFGCTSNPFQEAPEPDRDALIAQALGADPKGPAAFTYGTWVLQEPPVVAPSDWSAAHPNHPATRARAEAEAEAAAARLTFGPGTLVREDGTTRTEATYSIVGHADVVSVGPTVTLRVVSGDDVRDVVVTGRGDDTLRIGVSGHPALRWSRVVASP